jgi:tetratricopeptide (TPR) repeat protein
MAEKFRSSPVAVVAALTAADMRLNSGCQSFLSNKAKADSELEDAVNIYAKLLPELHNPNLIAQANFGLARAEECQSKLPEAKKHYEQVVKIQPDGPFGVLAASRLEDLGRPSMKIILDKIAQYKPDAFKNNSDIAGPAPFDPNNMPKEPLIDPESFGKKMNLNPEKKINLKSDELFKDLLPSSGDEPVKTENKDESKKPAAGETPAENPPAQETPAPAEENK